MVVLNVCYPLSYGSYGQLWIIWSVMDQGPIVRHCTNKFKKKDPWLENSSGSTISRDTKVLHETHFLISKLRVPNKSVNYGGHGCTDSILFVQIKYKGIKDILYCLLASTKSLSSKVSDLVFHTH